MVFSCSSIQRYNLVVRVLIIDCIDSFSWKIILLVITSYFNDALD